MNPLVFRIVCLVLAILTICAGGCGMALSFLFLGAGTIPDTTAGAAGFIAGSVMIGSGLISLALLAAREGEAPAEPRATPAQDRLEGEGPGRAGSAGASPSPYRSAATDH